MRKSVFAIDASPNAYIGYTSGRLWNGWATPYFTFEEAKKIQAEWNGMTYDEDKDEFRIQYDGDDEPYTWEGEDITTTDGIKHLYGIGAYSHIWDELGEGSKRYLAEQINELLYDRDPYEYMNNVNDTDDLLDDIVKLFVNLDTFVKCYGIMNDDKLNADQIYTKLMEVLM